MWPFVAVFFLMALCMVAMCTVYDGALRAGWGMAASMGLLASPLIVHKSYKRIYEDAYAAAHGRKEGCANFSGLPRAKKILAVAGVLLIAVFLVVMIGLSVWASRPASELPSALL